mmetsp:Transcript_7069/g.20079  ORF Transcript_7069/g.20079 Transcript_7069/m.20079 type:complete len:316 (+) Transcript_7069:754-1701(+)
MGEAVYGGVRAGLGHRQHLRCPRGGLRLRLQRGADPTRAAPHAHDHRVLRAGVEALACLGGGQAERACGRGDVAGDVAGPRRLRLHLLRRLGRAGARGARDGQVHPERVPPGVRPGLRPRGRQPLRGVRAHCADVACAEGDPALRLHDAQGRGPRGHRRGVELPLHAGGAAGALQLLLLGPRPRAALQEARPGAPPPGRRGLREHPLRRQRLQQRGALLGLAALQPQPQPPSPHRRRGTSLGIGIGCSRGLEGRPAAPPPQGALLLRRGLVFRALTLGVRFERRRRSSGARLSLGKFASASSFEDLRRVFKHRCS